MRLTWGALLLIGTNGFAAEPPLRFSIADSWAMPMVQIEHDQPTRGILHDMMVSLAARVGRPAEFHVLARARVQSAMEHGEVDIRCYAAQSWLPNQSGDYIWSIPLFVQRDMLVSADAHAQPVIAQNLPAQRIGTVLGYTYPSLQVLFERGQLTRDDARNQQQVLEKLAAGRNRYGVSNQWTLDWFNQKRLSGAQLHSVAVLQEQAVGCFVRNDPRLPVQQILRALLQMKMSGEVDELIERYTGTRQPEQATRMAR